MPSQLRESLLYSGRPKKRRRTHDYDDDRELSELIDNAESPEQDKFRYCEDLVTTTRNSGSLLNVAPLQRNLLTLFRDPSVSVGREAEEAYPVLNQLMKTFVPANLLFHEESPCRLLQLTRELVQRLDQKLEEADDCESFPDAERDEGVLMSCSMAVMVAGMLLESWEKLEAKSGKGEVPPENAEKVGFWQEENSETIYWDTRIGVVENFEDDGGVALGGASYAFAKIIKKYGGSKKKKTWW